MTNDLNIQYVDSLDRGLSYAESCFETFRIVDNNIFDWHYHWQRLQHGLHSFGIVLHHKQQQHIQQQCLDTAKHISVDCLLRLTISGGDAGWGLQQTATPNVFIQAQTFQTQTTAIHLQCVEFPFPLMPKIAKFSSDYALALRAAQSWNLDSFNTALVCKNGLILAGFTANIALYVDEQWLTPQGDGVIKGTIRQFLMNKQHIQPASCPTTMLQHIQAAVLLNSGSFLQEVHSIDGKPLDTLHPAITGLKQSLQNQQGIQL